MSYGYSGLSYTLGGMRPTPAPSPPKDKIPQHIVISAISVMVQQIILNKDGVSSWGVCNSLFIDDLSGRNVIILRENMHKVVSKLYPDENWPFIKGTQEIFDGMMHNQEIAMLDRHAAHVIAELQSFLVDDEILTFNFMVEALNGVRNPFHVLTIRKSATFEAVENTTVLTTPLSSLEKQIIIEGSEDTLLFFMRPKDMWIPKEKRFTTQIDITLMYDGGIVLSHVKGKGDERNV